MVLGALLLVFGRCGSSDDDTPANISALFLDTETTTLAAKGYATDPRLVLTGPVGTVYTVTVTEGGSWCWTSRKTQATTKSAQLVAASEVIYLYLDKNETGASRRRTRIHVDDRPGGLFGSGVDGSRVGGIARLCRSPRLPLRNTLRAALFDCDGT